LPDRPIGAAAKLLLQFENGGRLGGHSRDVFTKLGHGISPARMLRHRLRVKNEAACPLDGLPEQLVRREPRQSNSRCDTRLRPQRVPEAVVADVPVTSTRVGLI
jgi:hypothetical protein